ncbi:helix-turn-helix transcriptional regulator [Sphingobium sp. AP50]|uniref:helix-turn-helix transcriptional regulator n=1 Tax=Sphingobium sp. AP50 TaxID=1884369 RepID=UPI001C4344B7|nr:LuxR family transcriptional regulator [Sphingobium sp. AP50]
MDACRAISDESGLRDVLRDMTEKLGFNQYALLHHVDLAHPPAHSITLISYEDSWMERIIKNRYFKDDPILAASNRRLTGFGWREVPEIIRLSRRQRRILHEARAHGLRDGFTVPAQLAGEYRGTCSFAADRTIELTPDVVGCAQLVGMFCFEVARRITNQASAAPAEIPELTQRQLDCLVHVGSGKTNWETSVILGVSEDTVDKHVLGAMRRYGVGKRTLLIVRALFDGQLSYRDMLRMH